jgi:hypothetical protein
MYIIRWIAVGFGGVFFVLGLFHAEKLAARQQVVENRQESA